MVILNLVSLWNPTQAQAIMLLAGNGSSISSNLAQPTVQVQASSSKPAAADLSPVNQPRMSTPPYSRLSSPSHTGAQSGSGSTSTEEIMATKTTGAVTTHVTKPEHPKTANVVGSVTTTTMIPSGMIFFFSLKYDVLTYIVPLKNFPTEGFLNYAAQSLRACYIVYRLGFCLTTFAMYN